MGYRLEGSPLVAEAQKIVSHGVVTGTVQLPPAGHPIILMADRQTTGGYPVLGHVAAIDLPLLAGAWPGDTVQFREVTLEEAQTKLLLVERALNRINVSVRMRRATD